MTEEERRNRNPAVEITKTTTEAIAAMPEVRVRQLKTHRVYVLQSPRNIVTLNYMGYGQSLDPRTFDIVPTYHFHGPRANVNVFLLARPDGTLQDGDGTVITVREWTGPDA